MSMTLFDDELTLPGVITQVVPDYSSGYDTSAWGTTESVTIIGTAFNGPVGKPVQIATPEQAKYIFGDSFDPATKREATLVAEIYDAWQRGCRTIYAVRVSGDEMFKDFDLAVESNLKLRVSGLFPSNDNKACFMTFACKQGSSVAFGENEGIIKIYKPGDKTTIDEKIAGIVDSIDELLVTTINLDENGFERGSRLSDLLDVINNNAHNNVLRVDLVDKDGVPRTNSDPEVQQLTVAAMFPGIYTICRDEIAEGVKLTTDIKVVGDQALVGAENEPVWKHLIANTNPAKPYPIFAENVSVFDKLLPSGIVVDENFDFLNDTGVIDRILVANDVDYEGVDVTGFELYQKLGSGFARTACLKKLGVDKDGKPRYKVIGKSDWEEQLSLYCMIVAEPSDRKSAVFNQIIKAIQAFEAECNEHHSIDVLKSQEEHTSLEKRYKKATKDYENGKITKDEYDEAFRKYSTHKVIKPISLTLDDVTSESLTNEIESQEGCIALVSSEGGIFDIISGSYTNFPNIDIFLKGYSGDFIKVSRIGRPSLYVKNPRLTILLTVQPKVLESVVNNGTFTGRGLSARFLYSVPKSLVGSRRFETKPINFDNKKRFSDLIHEILKEPKSSTTYITLSNDAYSLLKDYYEEFESRLITDLKDIGGWAGKLVGNILRISALITRARNIKYDAFLYTPSTDDSAEWIVQKEDMESAIKLGNYFLEHARFAFDFMDDNTTKKQALNFLEKLKATKTNEISFREASRMCKYMNKKENATAVISLLVDYGYLREKQGTSRAHNKGLVYEVNPAIYDKERPP